MCICKANNNIWIKKLNYKPIRKNELHGINMDDTEISMYTNKSIGLLQMTVI